MRLVTFTLLEKNYRDHLFNIDTSHVKYEIPCSYPSWDIVFTRFWLFDLLWPQMTFDPTKNKRDHLLDMAKPHTQYDIPNIYPSWDIVFTRWFWPFDLSRPQMTFDLQEKTIGIIYAIWPTHILHMKSLKFTLLEISCFQCFDLLTSCDLKWPLTSTKNDRDHLRNRANPHKKYEIPHIYPSWDIMFTRFWPFYLLWP